MLSMENTEPGFKHSVHLLCYSDGVAGKFMFKSSSVTKSAWNFDIPDG